MATPTYPPKGMTPREVAENAAAHKAEEAAALKKANDPHVYRDAQNMAPNSPEPALTAAAVGVRLGAVETMNRELASRISACEAAIRGMHGASEGLKAKP